MSDFIIPQNKDVVVFVSDEELIGHKWERNYNPTNFANIEFVSVDKIYDDINVLEKNGIENDLVKKGAVLIRHPFKSDRFIDFNTSFIDIMNMKFNALSRVAQQLGAKEFNIKAKVENKKKIIIDAKGSVRYGDFMFGGRFHSSKMIKESLAFKKLEKYEGKFTEEGYNEAVSIARNWKFDDEIDNLINKRNPKFNKMNHQYVEIKATKEYDHFLESCAKLNSIACAIDLNADFRIRTSEKFDVYFCLSIDF